MLFILFGENTRLRETLPAICSESCVLARHEASAHVLSDNQRGSTRTGQIGRTAGGNEVAERENKERGTVNMENMANEAERGERRLGLVPRVARGCQPQDNNFIIGGITPARRGTVRIRGVGGSADIVSNRTNGTAISSPAVSPGRSRG